MPVTAKFSEEFYTKFGHRVVDELVDWFNQVDATYRSEFRELFEVNFARFDAKLEQRIAELRAEFTTQLAGLRAEFKAGIAELRAEFTTQIAELRTEFTTQIAELRAEFKAELSERIAGLETRLIRWMFLFWVGTIGTMIALLRFWSG